AVERQHHGGTRMLQDLAPHDLAVVVVLELLHAEGPDPSLVDHLAANSFERHLSPGPFLGVISASSAPPARPARKKSRSSSNERPIVLSGSPLERYGSTMLATSSRTPSWPAPCAIASSSPAPEGSDTPVGTATRTGPSNIESTVFV